MIKKTSRIPERVLGIDISTNHGAFVSLYKGELEHFRFVTERATVARKDKERGTYFFPSKLRDWQERSIMRLAFWSSWLNTVFEEDQLFGLTTHVGIEDYAYNAGMNSHQIGEISGLIRLKMWKSKRCIRLHDPSSVKMFIAQDGTASKGDLISAVNRLNPKTKAFSVYSNPTFTAVEEDLCDAYAVAQLVWTEILLRAGRLKLSDLTEKEVRVFNRCTKRWPTSLLDRDWIQWLTKQEN